MWEPELGDVCFPPGTGKAPGQPIGCTHNAAGIFDLRVKCWMRDFESRRISLFRDYPPWEARNTYASEEVQEQAPSASLRVSSR